MLVANRQDFSNLYIEISFFYSRLKDFILPNIISISKSLQNIIGLILAVSVREAELPNKSITERKEAHDIFGLVVLGFDQRTIHIC